MTSVAILLVGDELLDGRTADKNGAYFAGQLREHGVAVSRITTIGDPLAGIVATIGDLLQAVDFVVISGGIGPTADDRTREAVARFAGVDLVDDGVTWDEIVQRFEKLGRGTPNQANRVQALIPRGATRLPNPLGTAPGFVIDVGGKRVASVPGVPSEARRMFDDHVLPLLSTGCAIPQTTMLFAGVPESHLGHLLADEMVEREQVRVGITASWSVLAVTVRAMDSALLESTCQRVQAIGQQWYIGAGARRIEQLLVERLRAERLELSLAESCTGGLVASRVTGVPGASEVLQEAYVTYSNAAKQRILAVPAELLEAHGAVSEACVLAMVRGLVDRSGAALAGVVSGIAGPGGGSAEKPVGLVHFAIARSGVPEAWSRHYGDIGREEVRQRAATDFLVRLTRATSQAGR
ncbi:MAG: nicotinamide-nucleotide amidohydrolase family protein [Planctomycetes bacterium]|nr:nicotinamide-nucleotide amidohydrolase family protein [Planctomycetota bacterium]MCB9890379.1 nicotinamide-nucleotide amidohydrolase family protein [Planctomycetota bacterium]MCB9917621.1 nicotinamide-nucleotide amidohydrolase family protein [Planctomycetota bacterium]